MPKGKLKTVGNCRAVQIVSGGPGLDLDSVGIKDKPDSLGQRPWGSQFSRLALQASTGDSVVTP